MRGDIHCKFLVGKARIAPVKAMTVPHLELTSAPVSVQVGEMSARELLNKRFGGLARVNSARWGQTQKVRGQTWYEVGTDSKR